MSAGERLSDWVPLGGRRCWRSTERGDKRSIRSATLLDQAILVLMTIPDPCLTNAQQQVAVVGAQLREDPLGVGCIAGPSPEGLAQWGLVIEAVDRLESSTHVLDEPN